MVTIPKQAIAKELAFLDGYGTGIHSDSELTLTIWHECLNRELAHIHITPAELHECFYDIAKKATYLPGWERLTPQVLLSAVHARREQRIRKAPPPENPPDQPDQYPPWLEARRQALGDGMSPERAEAHAWAQIGQTPPIKGTATRKVDINKLLAKQKTIKK